LSLVGQTKRVADSAAYLVGVFLDFRVYQFSIHLRGDYALVAENFL